jgi:hypothetical protein
MENTEKHKYPASKTNSCLIQGGGSEKIDKEKVFRAITKK